MKQDKRTHIVAGNWKMNLTFDQADDLIDQIMTELEDISLPRSTQVVICPPAPYLEMASEYSSDSYFLVGAQDVSVNNQGAYTGEISADMLKSLELNYCIVGHSERRAYHGETNQIVARKVDQLLANELTPIVCCGENLDQRENGQHLQVVEEQVAGCLFHLTDKQIVDVVIAYEPVWAIGTGKTATPEQAQEIHAHIRKVLAEKYGTAIAEKISILYGGSCKPSNAKELFAQKDIDGGLIGGASLKAQDFVEIAKSF